MRNQAALLLIAIFAYGAAQSSAQDERIYGTDATGVKATLTPRKAKYFLGENILLDYSLSYEGDGAVAVDAATGLGTRSFVVTAVDESGKNAPESTRHFNYTGGSGRYARRGHPCTHTIPLAFYCRLEKPGVYRIRVAHKPEGTEPDFAIADDNPTWAEVTIEVTMPNEVQAHKVVAETCAKETDIEYYRHLGGVWEMDDYADFACLSHPVYLPILERLVDRKSGETRSLIGISHNPTPEATEALIRLWKDVSVKSDERTKITSALCDRLPDPEGFNRSERLNPIQIEDVDPQLVRRSWREDFAAPVREIARIRIQENEPVKIRCGAFILEAIGTKDDIPDLTAALTRMIPIVDQMPPTRWFGEVSPLREACADAAFALEAMAIRGPSPSLNPQTPGETLHFILTLKRQNDFRPQGWEFHCENWLQSESPFVREFALFNFPVPLPDRLVRPFQETARKAIATTFEPSSMHLAVQCATDLKVPVDEILGLLVDRLDADEQVLYKHVFTCLEDLLQTGRHENHYWQCTADRDDKQMVFFKSAWKKFLLEHGQEIHNGKLFTDENQEYQKLMYDSFGEE